MMDVEEFERSLLENARKGLGASASDRMRVQSRLVGHAAWWQAAPDRLSLFEGFKRSWKGGLALGFAVGALLGFGAGRGLEAAGGRGEREGASSSRAATSAAVVNLAASNLAASNLADSVLESQRELAPPPLPGSAEPGLAERSAGPAALAAGAVLEAPAVAARGHRGSAPARAASAAARAAGAEEDDSTLARELAMLQRARRALNRSDARLALGIVESLDERFPDGVLMEERVATRILSLCQLERTEEAREQGQRFLEAHPRSVYAERVRHSCAGQR